MTIPFIQTNTQSGIPRVTVNGTGIPLIPVQDSGIRSIRNINSAGVRSINDIKVADNRVWITNPPQAIPIDVPVTVNAGTPVVYMPGCVTVHKENAKNPANRNKMLVNDDPKQNVTLCDAGTVSYTHLTLPTKA